MKSVKYQIRKVDELNWQLFEWQDGGQIISRGRYAGQETQAKWRPLDSYHPDVDQAALALLKRATLANMEDGVEADVNSILAAVEAARQDVRAAVEAITPDEFRKKSARGRKPKEAGDEQESD